MIALTCDFYVFASRVTARFSTVFFSISHIAKTWYVRAFVCLLIRHKKSILSSFARLPRSLRRGDS